MNPVTETRLLLVVVIAGVTVGAMSHYWPDTLARTVAGIIGPCMAGFACGRINVIVLRATA